MKKNFLLFGLSIFITLQSCKKEKVEPLEKFPVELTICRKCEGTWDLTDTIPENAN